MSSSQQAPSAFAAAFAAAKRKRQSQNSNGNDSEKNISGAKLSSTTSSSTTTTTTTTQPLQSSIQSTDSPSPSICLLPQHVIDQIAAGEVVQRPVSVVKELLENSLDAGATHIVVHVERGGLSKLSISDNGCGISKKDLPLLATRHATSKLTSVDDFDTLQTFGFRGEAVASTSMVSRLLTVTTRTVDSPVAYTQTYQNGRPSSVARPCARTVGTTIVVQDLFHNVPHRQSAYSKKEGEEYAKILSVVQQYAIHYPNVGFVCQRQRTTGKGGASGGGVVVDCNTSQIPAVKALLQSRNAAMAESKDHANQPEIMEATKQILSHVLGANLREHLLQFHCSSLSSDTSAAWTAATSSSSQYKLQYEAQVYFTTPDYALRQQKQQQQGRFILFLNHRLVDLPPLKRAMEDAYVHFTVGGTIGKSNNTAGGNTARPVLVVNLTVPGAQVDVNVHPSKRQVALMYQEDVINAITGELRKQLEDRGQSFASQSVCNPYAKTKTTAKRKEPPRDDDANNNHDKKKANDNECATAAPSTTSQSETSGISSRNSNDNAKKQKVVPSKLIRTNRATPAGAIEPFLVQTQTTPSQKSTSSAQSSTPSTQSGDMLVTPKRQHLSDCPLSRSSPSPGSAIDMSQPGAFVDAMRCTCPPEAARQTVLVKQPVVRPKRVKPTHCEYVSIKTLRKRLLKQQCAETTAQMRKAFFMGVISNQRSLVQCGEELVLINHMEMAKELFYQLALARFGGGAAMAHLGELGGNGGIHVQTAIEQALQFEDNLILSEDGGSRHEKLSQPKSCGLLDVNETNHKMALQATSVLLEKADMLEEYFSIRIECTDPDSEIEDVDNTVDAVLTGLPVLLEGHSPQPHGLPIFLLRLATQVDWEEERPCFYGICKELGDFYAMSPNESDALNAFVRHNLFPALSYLLIPPKSFPANGYFTSMTKLSTLYKVFERC